MNYITLGIVFIPIEAALDGEYLAALIGFVSLFLSWMTTISFSGNAAARSWKARSEYRRL